MLHYSIGFPKRITIPKIPYINQYANVYRTIHEKKKKKKESNNSHVEAVHRLPLSSEHTTNPITATMRTGKLCDGAEEGGAGIVPKTVG